MWHASLPPTSTRQSRTTSAFLGKSVLCGFHGARVGLSNHWGVPIKSGVSSSARSWATEGTAWRTKQTALKKADRIQSI